jgi:hypothetical protein
MGTRRLSAKPMGGRGPWVDESTVGWFVDGPSSSEPFALRRPGSGATGLLQVSTNRSTLHYRSLSRITAANHSQIIIVDHENKSVGCQRFYSLVQTIAQFSYVL